MASYSIKDLEKMSGIKAHTIRIWEKRYSLVKPLRTSTNIRYYDDSDLKKLLNTSILIRNGIKISKISALSHKEIAEKVLLFTQQNTDSSNSFESLIIAMLELDETKFDHILSNLVISLGFEDVFIKVLYPLFERIGILWQAGTIMPAHEHFISNLVRQKLIVAIESQSHQSNLANPQFLLFLPEGEQHELGLLFFNYALRKRGFKTIYLGQNVPYEDILQVNDTSKSQILVTSINNPIQLKKLKEYVCKLAATFSDQTIFISGAQFNSVNMEFPHNVERIISPIRFTQKIDLLK